MGSPEHSDEADKEVTPAAPAVESTPAAEPAPAETLPEPSPETAV